MQHIQCELKEVLDDPDPALTPLRKELFVTYASLTLDVLVNQGFTPKLGFIHPLKADGTNRVIGLDSSLTGAQHRQVNQNFTLLLDPDYADPKKYPQFDKAKADACKPVEGPQGLRGRLGLKDVIVAGLRQFSQSDFLLPLLDSGSEEGEHAALSSSLRPNFGATIEFTLVYGLEGGPSWTLAHFTGSGLVGWSREVKDTLVISFASSREPPTQATEKTLVPAPPPASGVQVPTPPQAASAVAQPRLQSRAAAAQAAQDNVTRMILQRLLVTRP